MGRAIGRRAVTATLALVCAALAVPGAAAYAEGDGGTEASATASGPTAIVVPYLGTATIKPGDGWQITDCAGPSAATALVVACDATQIALSAPSYDPAAAAAVIVPVPLTNGRTSILVGYSVSLGPPEAPTVAEAEYGFPVAAGSTVMLPFSDLGIACPVCTNGGAFDVVDVSPTSAGTAASNGTHLVFRPAAQFSGDAEIRVRYADDFGTWSADATITVPVYTPRAVLVATSVAIGFGDGPQSIDLAPLAHRFGEGDHDVRLIGCGSAVHGTVVCAPDGTATYAPSGATADQFSYHVVSADGEQATGSVTLVADAPLEPTLVPASAVTADDGVPSKIVPRVPVENDGTGGREGVFGPLIATLDRAGAR